MELASGAPEDMVTETAPHAHVVQLCRPQGPTVRTTTFEVILQKVQGALHFLKVWIFIFQNDSGSHISICCICTKNVAI